MNIPGYQIKHQIGKGGMSTVYLAIQESLDREVALKVMAPILVADADFCTRFLKESKIIAKLAHPNIVTVYDTGAFETCYYMALEYAGGGNLNQRIKQKPLSQQQALEILKKIASALGYAHERGFIHRDVKPGNILFKTDETPLLTDFGIAKAVGSSTRLTQIGMVAGTPQYMSPEQVMTKPLGPHSDLYSLGILFYEMLTGKLPYKGENSFAIALMHINDPIPKLPEEHADAQPLLDHLVAKDPADRFINSRELIEAIEEFQASGTIPPPKSHTVIITDSNRTAAQAQQAASQTPSQAMSDAPSENSPQTLKLVDSLEGAPPTTPTPQVREKRPPAEVVPFPVADTSPTPFSRWKTGSLAGLLLMILAGSSYFLYDYFIGPGKISDVVVDVPITNPINLLGTRLRYLEDAATANQRVLKLDPDNKLATEKLRELGDKYYELAEEAWTKVGKDLSLKIIAQGLRLMPQHERLLALKTEIASRSKNAGTDAAEKAAIQRWLAQAENHLAASRFFFPAGENAVESYRQVLRVDPNNEQALRSLNEMAGLFEQAARTDLINGRIQQGVDNLEQGLMIDPSHPGLLELQKAIKVQNIDG